MADDVRSSTEEEINALSVVLTALAPLDGETRRLVLGYVRARFDLADESLMLDAGGDLPKEEHPPIVKPKADGLPKDIRTLKEQKNPRSAVEMAVLVAFYLQEVAQEPEKRASIGTEELTKYFKQADYPVPSSPRAVLASARNGGYLDTHTRGQYILNPVGYNLVAHTLPRSASTTNRQPRAKRKSIKASSAKKPSVKRTSARKRTASKARGAGKKP